MPTFCFGGLLSFKAMFYLNIFGKRAQKEGLDSTLLTSHAQTQAIHMLQQERWPENSHRVGHLLVGTDPRLALVVQASYFTCGLQSCGGFCMYGVWDFLGRVSAFL